MEILIGIIESENGDLLFTTENGEARLKKATDVPNIIESFPNYKIQKTRSLLINDKAVSGPGVFCFRYGPVMAGVREAGSFNLYTYGEKILHASIDLNWKYRNIDSKMEGKSIDEDIVQAERVCSNFAIAHSVAYCRAVENALSVAANPGTINWRIVLLEAERVYNHLYVIYRLANAAAQKVLASHLAALFEDALRLNERLTGSRYLMGINGIGKLAHTPPVGAIQEAISGYQAILTKFEELYRHSLKNSNYLDRLHLAGTMSADQAVLFGLTGPSLRACGLDDQLNGSGHRMLHLPIVTQSEGDALARMETRAEEISNSCQYIIDHLRVSDTWNLKEPSGETRHTAGEGCGMANSASGALGYYVKIEENKLRKVKIFTPSYPGMVAASEMLKGYIFTDFPFIYDSFGIYFSDAAL